MEKMKFITFTKEYEGENRDFEAQTSKVGGSLKMLRTIRKPSKSFGAVKAIHKIDDKRAEIVMWADTSGPWDSKKFEVEYDMIS